MNYRDKYLAQGYLSPLDINDAESAARHRQALEAAGVEIGKYQYLNECVPCDARPAPQH